MNSFEKLNAINVNGKTEQKNGLTYLSWAWAWAEVKKVYPEASYEVKKFEGGLPYVYDANTGYMVFTSVTIGDVTHEMWLPVMDANNKAMKATPYTIKTRNKEFRVAEASMFDINKTIMRCLTKNLAMFGLGLYIYAGEDLPEAIEEEEPKAVKKTTPKAGKRPIINKEQAEELKALITATKADEATFFDYYMCDSLDDFPANAYDSAVKKLNNKLQKMIGVQFDDSKLPESMR